VYEYTKGDIMMETNVLKREDAVFVKHAILVSNSGKYGATHRVYIVELSDTKEEFIWVTTSTKTILKESKRYVLSFDSFYDEHASVFSKYIQRVKIIEELT
jgi:hypothetical protein